VPKRPRQEMPPASGFRKARLYADADIEADLVTLVRGMGVNITSALEAGYEGRDDEFQLAEAERQRRFLLTKNGRHFLDDRRFPMSKLKVGVIVLQGALANTDAYGAAIRHLLDSVVPFAEVFVGAKVTLSASSITVKQRTYEGKIDVSRFEVRGGLLVPVD
jgi:Domain of unknown function (DUF5615)